MTLNNRPIVYVVDDDMDFARSLARLLERSAYQARAFDTPAAALEACLQDPPQCMISDMLMGDMDGFQLAQGLRETAPWTAIIFMTAWPKTSAAVDAIREFGGVDYLEKPIDEERLFEGLRQAVEWSERFRVARARVELLTPREWDVFRLLTRGLSNKMIAADLDIKPKTVEDHRASIMTKTRSNSVAQLVELAQAMQGRI